jgi:hypothetical protein
VPKSKVRKKSDASARSASSLGRPTRAVAPRPSWYPIVMAVILLLGLAYLVVYYLNWARGTSPLASASC